MSRTTETLSRQQPQVARRSPSGDGPYFSIYVKLVGTEESTRLTKQASVDFNPVWSPDGHYIAFCRIKKGETGILHRPRDRWCLNPRHALGGARVLRSVLVFRPPVVVTRWEVDRIL